MIEVPVRQDDGRGPRLLAEQLGRRALDPGRGSGQAAVDEGPTAIRRVGRADEDHVDDAIEQVRDLGRDVLRRVAVDVAVDD